MKARSDQYRRHGRERRRRHHSTRDLDDLERQLPYYVAPPPVVHRTLVGQYCTTAETVSGIATFAGAITLSTQLLIECPQSRLQALLALASQLFLATPLVLLGVVAVLHGRANSQAVSWDEPSRAFIVAQFLISGIMVVVSFLLLGCAIYVAEGEGSEHAIGQWGLALISLTMIIVVVAVWVNNSTNRFWRSFLKLDIRYTTTEMSDSYSIQYLRVFLLTFVPQLAVVGCLVGFGARRAAAATIQFGCGFG
ncbi:hypothetical protein A1O3_00493 [Capronia epimyces CBS 606.96]|uniref:Uncharacterized protein n=1 Tax=Capronia epimyces CBS 606.96 TaxID=1182542 RepID=W9YHD8_9EURO|nr:uncharacterized protein A1O3_00493 [Capronia epimyces CBS 606.96]EXJ91943.1 hypothetical protein A1O3_00493 [Capronia epimyces CBS 606.96]